MVENNHPLFNAQQAFGELDKKPAFVPPAELSLDAKLAFYKGLNVPNEDLKIIEQAEHQGITPHKLKAARQIFPVK